PGKNKVLLITQLNCVNPRAELNIYQNGENKNPNNLRSPIICLHHKVLVNLDLPHGPYGREQGWSKIQDIKIYKMNKHFIVFVFTMGCVFCEAQHFGEQGHPMTRQTLSLEVLKYWHPKDTKRLEVFANAHEILKSSKDRTFSDL